MLSKGQSYVTKKNMVLVGEDEGLGLKIYGGNQAVLEQT